MISRKRRKVKGKALCALNTQFESPRQHFYRSLGPHGFQELSYTEWGDPSNPEILLCVHGLTRNSRDFDYLAHDLKAKYRILCPDLLGHGKSDYVGDPHVYTFAQCITDIVTLLAHSGADQVHWLGTSIGGIIGMMLASQPHNPVKSLILNDVGMIVPGLALERIGTYARNAHSFSNFEDAVEYFQAVLAPMGRLDPKKWEHITKYGTLTSPKRELSLAYDPAIGKAFSIHPPTTLHLETYWKAIRCPILVLRGEESDFLPPDVATKMLYDQPRAKIVVIPDCGHAPSLMEKSQIQLIQKWLEEILQNSSS